MKISVQVVIEAEDDEPTVIHEAFALERGALGADTAGLRLDEAKDLLAAVQDTVVGEQVRESLAAQVACPDCGAPRRRKDSREIVVRTPVRHPAPGQPPLVPLLLLRA